MKNINDYLNIDESKFVQADDLTSMLAGIYANIYDGFDVDINVKLGTADVTVSNNLVIANSIGHIVENVIVSALINQYGTTNIKHVTPKEKLVAGENNSCDVIIKTADGTHNVEIKAYKSLSNLKPTAGQWNADYILCVKYSISGNHVNILEFNCVEPGQNPDKHTKITRNMINNGITYKK